MRKLFIIPLLLALVACSGMPSLSSPAWKIGITYAITDYIWKKPVEERAATKERIHAIVADLRKVSSGEAVSLPLLRQALTVHLDRADLEPPKRVLFAALADEIVIELTKRVGGGIIKPEQIYEIEAVLKTIEAAAS